MKKILLSLIAVSALHAYHHREGSRWDAGLRMAAATFAGTLTNTASAVVGGGAPVFNATNVAHIGINSFQGGAFIEAGYGTHCWYAGALFDINGDTLKETFENNIFTDTTLTPNAVNTSMATLKSPLHVGLDVRGGAYFSGALWYVLLGGEAIRYTLSRFNELQTTPFTTTTPAIATYSDSSWKGALRIGTGFEITLTENSALKLEYRFLWAGKRSSKPLVENVSITDEDITTTYTVTVADALTFRQQTTALMFAYAF